MTRVESENTRLRHYLARVTSQNLVLLQVSKYAEVLDSVATSLPQISNTAHTGLIHSYIQQRLLRIHWDCSRFTYVMGTRHKNAWRLFRFTRSPPAVESEEVVEKPNEPTPEEIKEVCIQLRHLSPDISINPQVKSQYGSVKLQSQ